MDENTPEKQLKGQGGHDLPASSPESNAGGPRKRPGYFFLVLGVVYPASVIVIELNTRMCASQFFDPMPTFLHTVLIGLVPAGNLLVWLCVRGSISVNLKRLGMANGIAIAVAAYYAVLFLPLTPLALIGIIWLIGLLPLAPVVSFIEAVIGRRYLKTLTQGPGRPKVPGTVLGLALGIAAIVALDAPGALTRIGMQMAVSPHSESRQLTGIRLLRALGDEDVMLRSCYRRSGAMGGLSVLLVSRGKVVTPEQSRQIYYRVTGKPFNAAPAPRAFNGQRDFLGLRGLDLDQGGDSVSARLDGLSLESSRLDGSVDASAALAYVEWTLVFKNETLRQQEARAQVALPPGGVVSRLTLWVDGVEREAVFARSAKVKEAYRKVVHSKRDPVLVTAAGPDRVLVQCFPVPPRGGSMKVRLGITAPLLVVGKKTLLKMPHFIERNFGIEHGYSHAAWIESKARLTSPMSALKQEKPVENVHALRGKLADSDLATPQSLVEIDRPVEAEMVWAHDYTNDSKHVVVQRLQQVESSSPQRMVLVVDGSAGMNEHRDEIARALRLLPDGTELITLTASDIVTDARDRKAEGMADSPGNAAAALAALRFVGGQDNVPALEKAWELAMEHPDTAIVWVHGPQPIFVRSMEPLVQRTERRNGSVSIYAVQVVFGPNRIVERMGEMGGFHVVPRLSTLEADLQQLFEDLFSHSNRIRFVRERSPLQDLPSLEAFSKTSNHLVRLWANDEIMGLTRSKSEADLDRAIKMATQYRLVTRLSGAVVLETDQDYARAGLAQPNDARVPSIPEPETWALLFVAIGVLFFALLRGRRKWQAA